MKKEAVHRHDSSINITDEILRDYFAGQMAPAILKEYFIHEEKRSWSWDMIAGEAYSAAAAMMKERKRREEGKDEN